METSLWNDTTPQQFQPQPPKMARNLSPSNPPAESTKLTQFTGHKTTPSALVVTNKAVGNLSPLNDSLSGEPWLAGSAWFSLYINSGKKPLGISGKVFYWPDVIPWPAYVAEWSAHSAAMCSRAWSAQWPRFTSQPGCVRWPKNYF